MKFSFESVTQHNVCGEGMSFFFLLGKSPDERGKEGDKGLALRLPHRGCGTLPEGDFAR